MIRNLNDEEPFHLYLDINAVNLDKTGLSPPQDLIFSEMRNSPILKNPSEYFLSIVRFTVQTPSLPLFIPYIKTGQANPNLTSYKVSMTYPVGGNTASFSSDIVFTPENTFEPTPAAPLVNVDFSTTYYYINNLNTFINQINTALAACQTGLNAAIVALGGVSPTANPPFFEYDPYTDRVVLFADTLGYNDSSATYISLFLNTALYNLLSSLQAECKGFALANERNYRLRIFNDNGLNIFQTSTGIDYLNMYQNYSTLKALCNPVQSIVFSTGMIPIVPSMVSAPLIFLSAGNVNTGSSNNDNIENILTDFEVDISADECYKPQVHYIPSGEYRLKDLFGNNPLYAVQMRVFWKTQFGQLIPFKLSSGCSANMKILFRKKEYNIQSHRFQQ